MEEKPPFSISDGFQPDQRDKAVRLFWAAFKDKLHAVMGPEEKAIRFLDLVVDPAHAISAMSPDGTLIGIAGFKTRNGAFIGGDLKELRAIYGAIGGVWRGLVLSLLERPLQQGTLLMDGIFVGEAARGQGVGSALLDAIKAKARDRGYARIRLDVIDSNPRARALYERQGFVAEHTSKTGPFRHVFGFRSSTMMIFEV